MKKLFSLLAIMLLFANANAQVAPYTFTQLGASYSEIVGDTTVAFATTTTTSGPLSMDDSVYANNSLPFPFTFSGTIFNNVVISSNGYVTFGATLPGITNYTPISTAGLYSGVISGYARDMIGNRGITATRTLGSNVLTAVPAAQFVGLEVGRIITGAGIPAATTVTALNSGAGTVTISANATAAGTSALLVCSGSIVRGTTGSVGSRVHTIQFKNIRPFSSSANVNCINFQVKLYETTNLVEIVYGTNTNSVSTTGQVGLRGSVNTDFNNRNTATANWATTVAGALNTNTLAMSSTITPATGTTFRWAAPAPPVGDDVGVTAAVFGTAPTQIISVGKGYNVVTTVKNIGTNTQNVIPVYYTVNGGSPVGPVNTVGPIITGASENVTFSGGFAFTPTLAGLNTVKMYTALAGDGNAVNDTFTVLLNVQQKIASYPYVQTFGTPTNWTVVVENAVGTTALWGLGICTNANGVTGDTAATSNCFNGSAGRRELLRSPEMDISSLSNPVLDFYVAYRTFTGGENDSMQVLLSTDGGVTYFSASTSYNKSNETVPSLATRPPSSTSFFPDSAIQWRHETINLANVAGSGNIVIAFKSISDFGNRQWVDNVIVNGSSSLCTDAVTGPGTYNCNILVTLDFLATPVPPPGGFNQVNSTTVKSEVPEDNNLIGFPTVESNVKYVAAGETDNPTGGEAFVTQYSNVNPGQGIAPNVGFTNATPPVGPAYDPTNVYHDYWFTVTYTGNDRTGYATYDIKIDLDGLIFTDPSTLYVVKRADRTGNWVCQNTTLSGNTLIVSGLTDFSDFAIAGAEALPVELASFVSTINGRNVELNWATSSETNNQGFDVERTSVNGTWSKIGNVTGNGTTTNGHSYSFTDRNLATGNYSYRLKQIDFNGNFEYFNLNNEVNVGTPVKFELSQNYPNPFNPSTKINYDLPFDSKVSIKLFDISGREVMTIVNETKTAGYYSVNFNGASLSSGIYFYSITAEGNGQNFVSTKKMTLIK